MLPLTPDEIKALEAELPNQRKKAASDDDRLRIVSVDLIDTNDMIQCTYSTETANEARARWQNHATDDNSYHSAVPGNPAHAAGVTAYDLSIGAPVPVTDDDKAYLDYLCAVADWRTDWKNIENQNQLPSFAGIWKFRLGEKTEGAGALIDNTFAYYKMGVIPPDIAKNDVAAPPLNKYVVNHTVAQRLRGE